MTNASLQGLLRVVRGTRREIASDARAFEPASEGSGCFGQWTLDRAGLPAYRYDLDQYTDPRARYANTEDLNRRDHWHQIGNDRVTALASNDGVIQFYIADQGGVFLNRFEARDYEAQPTPGAPALPLSAWLLNIGGDALIILARAYRWLRACWYRLRARAISRQRHEPVIPRGASAAEPRKLARTEQLIRAMTPHAYSGGFGYLDDGAATWATAFRYRPQDCETGRVFGVGRCETTMTHRNIRLTRQVYAPSGDDPLLLVDARIENLGAVAADLRYYEYWDVNIHRLQLQWLRSGPLAVVGDETRRALNDAFTPGVMWDGAAKVLLFQQSARDGAGVHSLAHADEISDVDRRPCGVFLADLSSLPPAAQYTDKAAFFGRGGVTQPDAVRARRDGEVGPPSSRDAMPCCLVLRHDVHLEPGASVDLRYAYGAAQPADSLALAFLDQYRSSEALTQTLQTWKDRLVYFKAGDDADSKVLQREMAWHAHNLLAATLYNAYYDAHVVPQGSAYLYLHGADGAPRDQALFALPLVYLRPDLARDSLRLIMSMTHADTGAIPYAFAGHGFHSDGLGIHAAPSDLDLFFLLALSEYIAASGDRAFLETEAPFYPRGARPAPPFGLTVLDHVRVAVKHLTEAVGIGEHGLLKIGDGDWSDAIVFETALKDGPLGVNFENSKQNGESVPNSQMALHVLPLMAAIVEPRDAALAAQMRALLPRLETGVMLQWNGRWFTRAVLRDFGDKPVLVADSWINLEAQPWALISGVAARMGKAGVAEKLIDSICKLLDDPSPIGAPLSERGMVWPAVSQLLTWGYTRSRPDLAWRSLKRHTFAARAKAFPDKWFSVWSGPDGINAADAPNPGCAWFSPATPMTDFPVMNANQDAMALLGLLRVCGIEPAPQGDGLLIAPQTPPEQFVLDLPLLRLDVAPGRIAGEYRAATGGACVLHVRAPAGARLVSANVSGQPVAPIAPGQAEVALPLTFQAGQHVSFEVRWDA